MTPWDISQAGDPKLIDHLKNATLFFDTLASTRAVGEPYRVG